MHEEILRNSEKRMRRGLEALRRAFARIRTGRAHPSLLEGVRVDSYGSELPLAQLGTVSVADPHTLTVNVWDRGLVGKVEKAIQEADLGLNPVTKGAAIYITVPRLTSERRLELAKQARVEAEQARVSLRNLRRDGREQIKRATRETGLSEDDEQRGLQHLQEILDRCMAELELELEHKEQELIRI